MERKRFVICILTVLMLIFSVSTVFAMDDLDGSDDGGIDRGDRDEQILDLSGNNVNNSSNITQNQTTNNNSTYNNTNNNVNNNMNNNAVMPNTGLEDSVPFIAIGICVISAVVAYTQIKKYNV